MDPLLLIFLLINAVFVGVVATFATQHAIAHFRPTEEKKKAAPVEQLPKMLPEMKKQLLAEAEAKFRGQIETSTKQLEQDLQKTTSELETHVTKIGGQIIETEMKRYRDSLEALRVQTENIVKQAQAGVAQHQTDLNDRYTQTQAEMQEKLKADLAAEKEKLIAQADAKLSDAVLSFLMETLQHDVDLGAQTKYMMSVLDEHKDEIVKEMS